MKDLEKQINTIFTKADRSSWQKVKFGDIAKEVKESCSNPEDEELDRVVGLEHLTPLDIHIRDWKSLADGTTFTRVFRRGQVLFGRRRAYQRKAALAEFDGLCSGDIIVMEAIEDKLNPDLLPFIVHSDKFYDWAVSTSAGSLSPRTKFKHLAELELEIPNRSLQNKVVGLLTKLDDYQEKLLSAQQSAEEARLVMARMLFDNYKGDRVEVGEVASVRAGYGFPHSLQGKTSGKYPFIKVSDMNDYPRLMDGAANYVDDEELIKLKAKPFEEGTIIFPKVGAAIFTNKKRLLSKKSLVDNNVMGLTVQEDRYLNEYMYYFFLNLDLGLIATQGALPAISAGDIKKINIPDIDISEQRKVISKLSDFDRNIDLVASLQTRTKVLRQHLLNKLVT
ncbi:hypothetical protein CL652_02525 [bacterium]|nr:hypothetical protein [bacterium]|tara:strand:- start:6090 stop:7268 length:1179 start_codon:yes stop_codon:yes gene_type:complete